MEKPKAKSAPASMEELQCVGSLEVVRPKPVGFLCGSIPVPTDKAFHDSHSALIPSAAQPVQAPRYRIIPTETDLNMLPIPASIPDKMIPVGDLHPRTNGDLSREKGVITSNLTRKGEALAVSGLVEYGDDIDVIAPADILKQIFKMPYSKARLSVAVHRVGQTLVLNTGPDVEEGEKLVRRHKNQSKGTSNSLFLNFAMHSVRMEACDCPPRPPENTDSGVLPGQNESGKNPIGTAGHSIRGQSSSGSTHQIAEEDLNHHQEYSGVKKGGVVWGKNKSKRSQGKNAVKKMSQENPRHSVQESEKYNSVKDSGFLRVLFWQFHQFRMLLGSDLLILSNEKYVAVSLHLWDVSRQVTPLTWLEAWLDNVMASVPELAICYHRDGVVQGYELLKTDDIFLLKGISEDGTPAFHPHVVKQNGHMVLGFLQENCKEDPGAYWLYKSAGEDLIQLFDLTMMPKNHSPDECDNTQSNLPSLINRGRSNSLLSLGTMLYRIAHKLSLSMSPDKRSRCVKILRKCLNFLDEPDHLVVRAFAHEQFARLLLNHDSELDFTSEAAPTDYEANLNDVEEESEVCPTVVEIEEMKDLVARQCLDLGASTITSVVAGPSCGTDAASATTSVDAGPSCGTDAASANTPVDANLSSCGTVTMSGGPQSTFSAGAPDSSCQDSSISDSPDSPCSVPQVIKDSVSSKLAAIHHVSQAIKSIRWKRQLQTTEVNMDDMSHIHPELQTSMDFSVCACGDPDCIEVCDLYEWLPMAKLDDKVWKLVLLLGESYLALGQAYKDDGQLLQALKAVELACLVYGSMPQHLEETRFISSMVCSSLNDMQIMGKSEDNECLTGGEFFNLQQTSSDYLFWARAWTLVGDAYVEFYSVKGKEVLINSEKKPVTRKMKMPPEVLKEVERLKKKLGELSQSCSSCSLVNCSCMSDRVSSGSSASSSSANVPPSAHGRKTNKKTFSKTNVYSRADLSHQMVETNQSLSGKKTEVFKGGLEVNADTVADKKVSFSNNGREDTTENMKSGVGASNYCRAPAEKTKMRDGGIFKYISNPVLGPGENNLEIALSCYEEANRALGGCSNFSGELQSVRKKKGWVCNELGRSKLDKGDLDGAEIAFADAIKSFREVSDFTNIILINCNLGHGRRASAEDIASKIETFKKLPIFHSAHEKAVETAKLKYSEALLYYGAAKMELDAAESVEIVSIGLKDQVYTQFAHTYLRLGILLAREDTTAEVYENGVIEDYTSPIAVRPKKDYRKHEISANDAIREALSIYESLGDLRKQEAAYAYFQLACYQKECCLKFFGSNLQNSNLSRGESLIKVKQYASLADRNWHKSMDFYRPETHPLMYLNIVVERSDLSLNLGSSLHSNMHLETALTRLLEARHLSQKDSLSKDNPELCTKFWNQLRMLLKRMLSATLAIHNKSGEVARLRELYKLSLKSAEFRDLHTIHVLWST